jgi:glutamate--cysteine ligase catalytic subunit
MQNNVDKRLAVHVASLFVRDPIPAYSDEFDCKKINDEEMLSHFENLQSTNWNSLRFKPPPSHNSSIGWRVEFRTMDIQLTDYENSALIIMLGMITNILNNFNIDFFMPISKIDINMERAHMRDAVTTQKFWWKINILGAADFENSALKESDFVRSSL